MPKLHGIWKVLWISAVATACANLDRNSPTGVDTGSVTFARYVALGDNLTAGMQSNGLVARFQQVSYPALIASAVRTGRFEMPLISEPGIPPLLVFKSFVPTVEIDTLPGLGTPINSTYPGIFNNLGIPGATVHSLLVRRPVADPGNPFYQIVLRDSAFGPTALAQATALRPTFLTLWAGPVDILASALHGTDTMLTDAASFESDFRTLIDAARAASAAMVAANLPDIRSIPFFVTIPPVLVDPVTRKPVLDGSGQLIPLLGEFQGSSGSLPLTSFVTLAAAPLLAQGIGVPSAYNGTGTPLPDAVILDPTEAGAIIARTNELNAVVDSLCANRGIPVVDFFAFFNDLKANGATLRGAVFTSDYVTGGLFSVDGVHPSSLGYYLIARQFVRKINASFGAAIPDPPLPIGPFTD
jgi:hypothetical protein